jgi:hypothetical protein
MTSPLGLAIALSTVAIGSCAPLPEERFVTPGRVLMMWIPCPDGGFQNADAAYARFDAARPGVKGPGYSRGRVISEIERHGGAIVTYGGRVFRSPYLHVLTHNWIEMEEPVTAEAIVPSLDRGDVYVEMPIWKGAKRVDGVFFPWSAPPGAPICVGAPSPAPA